MDIQTSDSQEVQKKSYPKFIWKLLWVLVIALFVLGGILPIGGGPGLPPGGLMETLEEKAEYDATFAKDRDGNIPSFISGPKDTLSFNFNKERLLFDPAKQERRKDISTNGSYSPIVVIPWKVQWHLETLDTTDVWFKDGSHLKIFPGMKPVDVGRKVAVFRFKSDYPVTVWLDNI